MALRLDDGESGQLITPLTIQNLAYQGAPNEGVNKPDYATAGGSPVHYINNDDNLTVALAKLGYAFTSRFGDTISGTLTWANGSRATFASGSITTHASGSTETYASGSSATFAAGTAKFGGAGAGIATLQYANSASSPTFNLPSKAAGTYTIATTAEIPDTSHVTYDNVAETISYVWDFTTGATFGGGAGQIKIDYSDIFLKGTNFDSQWLHLNRWGYNGYTERFRNLGIYNGKNDLMLSCLGSTDRINTYSKLVTVGGIEYVTDHDVTTVTAGAFGGPTSLETQLVTIVTVKGRFNGDAAVQFHLPDTIGWDLVSFNITIRGLGWTSWRVFPNTGSLGGEYRPSDGLVYFDWDGDNGAHRFRMELHFVRYNWAG